MSQITTTVKDKIMPIELMFTDSEILKIRKGLLKKATLNAEELETLAEINAYTSRK